MSDENIVKPPESEENPPQQPNITPEGVTNQIRRDMAAGGFGEIEDYEQSLPEGATPKSMAVTRLISDAPSI
jgi:hypothetical protein